MIETCSRVEPDPMSMRRGRQLTSGMSLLLGYDTGTRKRHWSSDANLNQSEHKRQKRMGCNGVHQSEACSHASHGSQNNMAINAAHQPESEDARLK